MKKNAIFVFIFCLLDTCVSVFGQVEGIEIGDAIHVTNTNIQLNKPLKSNLANQTLVSPELVTFDFPKCDLQIGNGISYSGPIIIKPTSAPINPSIMDYGFLTPGVTDYMDLGSSNFRFRDLYIKRINGELVTVKKTQC